MFNDYTHWLYAHGKADSTVKTYIRELKGFETYLHQTIEVDNLATISRLDAQDYKRYLINTKSNGKLLSPKTINKKIESIRTYYRFLFSKDNIPSNPFDVVKTLAIPKHDQEPRWLSRNEKNAVIRVIDNLDNWGKTEKVKEWKWKRNKAIVYCMLLAGLRSHEVTGLTLESIDLDKQLISVYGKGTKPRRIEMNKTLIEALTEWIGIRGDLPSEAVFIGQRNDTLTERGIRHVMATIRRLTSIEELSAHSLRHTFGHDLAQHVSLRIVADLMGHSDINTTRLYVKSSANERRKAIAML